MIGNRNCGKLSVFNIAVSWKKKINFIIYFCPKEKDAIAFWQYT
jgi:hypothetical protein